MKNLKLKTTILLTTFLYILLGANVYGEVITLQWDLVDPAPDGYKIFHRIDIAEYNYNFFLTNGLYTDGIIPGDIDNFTTSELENPELINPLPATIDDTSDVWDRSNSVIHLSWSQPKTVVSLNHYFVARSFVGNEYSVDSNEVEHVISIEEIINYWKVYYSETSGGPWIFLGQVENTGQTVPTITDPITVVQQGERKTIYFTVVSFVDDELYSVNANEVTVDIDRRIPIPPSNLRIEVSIPVQ